MKAQKINSITLETYEIIISIFFILGKDSKVKFFEKSFLLTNIKPDAVFGMFFLL